VTLEIGSGDNAGRIVLLLPVSESGSVVPAGLAAPTEERTAEALGHVDVDLVVELGRAVLPLARVASLAVGDVLRVPLPLDAAARVRVGSTVLFRGRPTTSGHQIAVAIDRHGD
jgi:flagellar motor switch protein FliM